MPVQTPEPPRVLAVVVAPVAESHDGKSTGHGLDWGHPKRDDSPPAPEAPVAPPAVPVVPPSQDDPSGDAHGNGNGNGDNNGNDHGQGSAHDSNGGTGDSGD